MRTLIELQFLGGVASDNLTGSCALLTTVQGKKSTKILIDVGLIQCSFKDSLANNQAILKMIDPSKIDFIIATHSHIDHIGRIPLFTKNGFRGRIICTKATRDLLSFMLEDSAKIQMTEALYLNNKNSNKPENAVRESKGSSDRLALGNYDRKRSKIKVKDTTIKPLYTTDDVEIVESLIKNDGYDYGEWFKLDHNICFKFYPSGHVMGGAIVVLKITTDDGEKYFCFTGDLGRKDGIILPPPEIVKEPINYYITEATYGGKSHPTRDEEIKKIIKLIKGAYKNKQKIIIPSFALERSQELIYLLSYYMNQGLIPKIPIYLDSPLAAKITSVFAENWQSGMFADQGKLNFNPFKTEENKYLNIITEAKESERLVSQKSCYIAIAGSGMCDAGRVRDYLRHNLSNKNTIVCLVGYMAKNSLGQRLKEKYSFVTMNKQIIKVDAEIISFDSFSAHADGPFLAEYAESVFSNNLENDESKRIFLVHSEEQRAEHLKINLENKLAKSNREKIRVVIPKLHQKFVLI